MICGYGPPDSQDKREFWSSLEHVVLNLTEPSWLRGDFSEVMFSPEKTGGRSLDNNIYK